MNQKALKLINKCGFYWPSIRIFSFPDGFIVRHSWSGENKWWPTYLEKCYEMERVKLSFVSPKAHKGYVYFGVCYARN
jgi:hypothetical protein